jgi:Homeodomain-like domain-containing protein
MSEPSSTPLTDALAGAMAGKADARAPTSVHGAVDRFGWTTRDIAREFNVSERTARRWRQQDRIPERRAGQWRNITRREATRRQREQIERRGIKNMSVTGVYRVSRSRYRARGGAAVRIMGDNRITGETMRGVFSALDEGRADDAERLMNDALADAYGAPGLQIESVDSISYTVR